MDNELSIILPVYNEAEIIEQTLISWELMLSPLNINYCIHAYNDGSSDNTLAVMQRLAQNSNRIIVHDKLNSGHGPTILSGYKQFCTSSAWIFQTDSDGEMSPHHFLQFWERRHEADFLIARRTARAQCAARAFISAVSRWIIRLMYGRGVHDVNCPYRLMKAATFKSFFCSLPENTLAPNIAISGYVNSRKIPYLEFSVPHTHRKTGEVSIKHWKLLSFAIRAFLQTFILRFKS